LLQLGDQLIKNESIALMELVKTSYDADANKVDIYMEHVDDPEKGIIIIEDDGFGMDVNTVENVWMEPESDYKSEKFLNRELTPKYKTLPIGEKGIGRFGVHKLGNQIEMITKKVDSNEVYVRIDWTVFNKYKYLDEVPITIPSSVTCSINSKLHISNKNFTVHDFEQGNIYLLPNQDSLIEKIIWQKKFKTRRQNLLDSIPQLVQLDITPVCDYSQNKEYVRSIFGGMLNTEFASDCKGTEQYYYLTPSLEINGQEKVILFDFRYIKTLLKNEIIQRNVIPGFRLRREICTDIQSQLSNQINRPGISNV
jgi:hypothetical protein